MPPKAAYRKIQRPAFKPPRPVTASLSTESSRAPPREGPLRKKARTGIPSSSASDSNSVDSAINDEDEVTQEDQRIPAPAQSHATALAPPGQPVFPPKLLSRLMHENFQHEDTRITKEAMGILSKYMELFTMEAVGRANAEREEAALEGNGEGSDFLEVEDLEKLAPQLLMDF